MNLSVEQTYSQFLVCRFAPNGCDYVTRFQPGQHAWARGTLDAHEATCPWRWAPTRHPLFDTTD